MSYNLSGARKAILAECNQRGIDAATRHQLLRDVGRVASGSTKDMGADAARRVLDHLRRGQTSNSGGVWDFVRQATPERQKYLWKIRRLLLSAQIAEAQHIAYAEGIARQMAGLNAATGAIHKPLALCDETELWRIVQALSKHLARKRKAEKATPTQPTEGATP